MARRTAVKHSPESKKLQNRINQRAFRARQRAKMDLMCTQLANYEASGSHNLRNQPHEATVDQNIQKLSFTPLRPWDMIQPAPAPNSRAESPTLSSLGPQNDNAFKPETLSHGIDPSLTFNALNTNDHTGSKDQNEVLGNLQTCSDGSIHNYTHPCQMGDYKYPQTSSFEQSVDLAPIIPSGSTGNATSTPFTANAFDPIASVTEEFVNAQHFAFRSAEWYAKAAEVGIAVAKMRQNAWLIDPSLWPQWTFSDLSSSPMSNDVGAVSLKTFANSLSSCESMPQPMNLLSPYNASVDSTQAW